MTTPPQARAALADRSPADADPSGERPARSLPRALDLAADYAVLGVLALLLVAATLANDRFWSIENLKNIFTQNAPIGLVALGMTFVIVAGAFDLSVGALFAAGGVFYAGFALHMPLALAALAVLGIGVAAGLLNGIVVERLRVNSFIGTIGTGAVFAGVVYIYSGSSPIQVAAPGFQTLGFGTVAGVPWPLAIYALAFALSGFLLSRTVFGRYVYAAGGNEEAARLAGVPVRAVRVAAFALVGAGSVAAGMIVASQLGVGQPTLGASTALDAFAIVIIGGTSVYGGEGAMWRTTAGVAILAVLSNLFNSLAWDASRQSVAKGLVLIAAVAVDALRQRRA